MKRVIIFVLCGMLGASLLTGCDKKESELDIETFAGTSEPTEATTKETQTTTAETEHPGNMDPLTGLYDLPDEAVGKRPVAVAINNVAEAMPQYGVVEAEVVFETLVEGTLTRLLAVYSDCVNLPDICSVRSYRYYFPPLALGFDAFYVHWGRDPSMIDYYNELDMDAFDGDAFGHFFTRDRERLNQGYNIEHTSVFEGPLFAETMKSEGYRLDIDPKLAGPAFKFNKGLENIAPEGEKCTYVKVDFGGQWSSFEYNEKEKKYYKTNYGEPQCDGKTGEQMSFTNLFILETDIWIRPDGVHKGINWNGGDGAVGHYISGGKIHEITWSKVDEYSRLKFFELDGKELSINRGKSYITLCYDDSLYYE